MATFRSASFLLAMSLRQSPHLDEHREGRGSLSEGAKTENLARQSRPHDSRRMRTLVSHFLVLANRIRPGWTGGIVAPKWCHGTGHIGRNPPLAVPGTRASRVAGRARILRTAQILNSGSGDLIAVAPDNQNIAGAQ